MAVVTITATKDASCLQANDGWSGWDDHHPVGISTSGNKYRSFIYFPINFSGMTNITAATLNIKAHRAGSGNHVFGASSGNTRTLHIRLMTSDWGEGTNRGETLWSSAEPWGWINRSAANTAYAAVDRVFGTFTDGTVYNINIPSIVQAWKDGVYPNYGIILFLSGAEETDTGAALEFYSRDSAYKPTLTITYDTNTAPNAPTGLSPTSDALVNALTPTLTGTRSDPDAGDYITAYQINLYADDGTSLIWDSGTLTQTGTSTTFSKVYSGPALTGNNYYKWKARTRDSGSVWGPYSSLQRFKVNTPPNPPWTDIWNSPIMALPTLTPTLAWTHNDNDPGDSLMYGWHVVVEYDSGVALWDSGDIDISGSPQATIGTAYAGPALTWNGDYRWRARTKDSNGVWGTYSANQYFSTRQTNPPAFLDPSAEEVISGLAPLLHGERSSFDDYIVAYDVIVRTDDGVTTLWAPGIQTSGIYDGAAVETTYGGSALSYGTRYAWWLRVEGTTGGWSEWSQAFFNTPVDATVPIQDLPTPNAAGRITSLTPTFTGSRASGAFTHYQIQLYPATATTSSLGSPIWDTGDLTQSSSTSFSKLYDGVTLAWNTLYKWRVRVGSPTLGNWTGLASFTTDAAGAPTLTSPADGAWITDSTPDFSGTSAGGESITAVNIILYNATGTTQLWDSGWLSQASATSFTKTYAGPALVGGTTYRWAARYQKSGGVSGSLSGQFSFRLDGGPLVPTSLSPLPGQVIADTVLPLFKATFDDPERLSFGDYPTAWTIEIRLNSDDSVVQTKVLTTGLISGPNQYQWGTNTGGADTGLAYNTLYKWRTWFTDSKGVAGAASGYQIFSFGHAPTVEILTPSNGSNVNTTRPMVTWTYDDPNDLPQMKYQVQLYRSVNGTRVYLSGEIVSSATSFQIPTGYLQYNGETYALVVYVVNSAGLYSVADIVEFQLELDAPPRIEGLSATVYEDQSKIVLDWDASSLSTNFISYVIYRKLPSESDWTMIGTRKPETNVTYTDWYAGQRLDYHYRVTVVKKIADEPDLESPDSDIVTARLISDVWFVVGADRSEEHIFELPVSDESHNRPVQQEEFEPIGSNRKAVVRGFVLGHEGSVDVAYLDEETMDARHQIEYLLFYAGPHILKTPFGDVYDVTFGSPDYKYLGGGNMNATLTWIETGATNNPGLTPDQYLASIGAE